MYYTVGSQCPKIPIPDRVPIAELFSSVRVPSFPPEGVQEAFTAA